MRGCLLLLLTACRSDDEVEGRARALLEAARRAKAPEAPTGPVSLTVENLGVLRVDPGVDPADVVEAFYSTALQQNVTLSLKNLTTILDKLCVLAPCRRRFHKERLTANVKGVGTLVVEPWVEPARAVAELGRAAESAGNPLGESQLRRVLDAVCEKRACVDALDRRLELNVTGVGRLVVEPWHDVADAIEGWTAAATMSGHDVSVSTMKDLYEWCCKRRSCGRALTPPLTLNVSGLGSVTCLPTEEPATAVERLASTAAEAYISVLPEQLDAAMAWFCARRSCHRPVAPMRLDVEGVGALEVPPWGEPAAAVTSVRKPSRRPPRRRRDSLVEFHTGGQVRARGHGRRLRDNRTEREQDARILLFAPVLPADAAASLNCTSGAARRDQRRAVGRSRGRRRGVWRQQGRGR